MKSLLNVVAVCCLLAFAVGCETSQEVNPGAVGACGTNCEAACCSKDASLGAVKDGSSCCPFSKQKSDADASLGAVGDGSGCSKAKSSCSGKSAPADDTSLGAVGDGSGCSKAKSSCSGKTAPADDTSLGAVSDKPSCSKSKARCGSGN